MKFNNILLILLCALCISCKPKVIQDKKLQYKIDSLNIELNIIKDNLSITKDSLRLEQIKYKDAIFNLSICDSSSKVLNSELFVANYKLGRIKEYCDIVKRDNTQLKYLRGWVMRALED